MTPPQGTQNAVKIVGLGGSMKPGSLGLKLLEVTLKAAAEHGAETRLFPIHELGLPLYDPAVAFQQLPAPTKAFLEAMRGASGYVWCSPAYHGTVSGAVKNALDYLEYLSTDTPAYLTDKPVGLIAPGGGAQAAVNTLNAMTHAAQSLRAVVLPLQAPVVAAGHSFGPDGRFSDAKMHDRLNLLGKSVVDYARKLR